MRFRTTLAATAALALPTAVMAQPVDGLYVGAGALYNYKQVEHAQPALGTGLGSAKFRFDEGGVGGVGSVGYGFGNGFRVELEGDYRQNSLRQRGGTPNPRTPGNSTEQDYGAMVNALYDFDLRPLGVSFVTPYLGVGAGYQWSHLNGLNSVAASNGNVAHFGGTDGNFAYQGIVGLAFPISFVPGLAVTTEYRFLGILGDQTFQAENFTPTGVRSGNYKITENLNHSFLLGVRYAFNQPQPAPVAAVQPIPAVTPARTYLVFFDWDRADLTDRARQIIAEAAQASTRVQYTRIEVQGNADRSGTPAYNQGLSLRRAQTVAAELVRQGVPRTAIDIQAFGDTRPLVPTAAGVREPQNRRVAIILR